MYIYPYKNAHYVMYNIIHVVLLKYKCLCVQMLVSPSGIDLIAIQSDLPLLFSTHRNCGDYDHLMQQYRSCVVDSFGLEITCILYPAILILLFIPCILIRRLFTFTSPLS